MSQLLDCRLESVIFFTRPRAEKSTRVRNWLHVLRMRQFFQCPRFPKIPYFIIYHDKQFVDGEVQTYKNEDSGTFVKSRLVTLSPTTLSSERSRRWRACIRGRLVFHVVFPIPVASCLHDKSSCQFQLPEAENRGSVRNGFLWNSFTKTYVLKTFRRFKKWYVSFGQVYGFMYQNHQRRHVSIGHISPFRT